MPSRARLEWDGDSLFDRLANATREAIDETLDATDHVATSAHWWHTRSGYLQRKIVTEPATIDGNTVRGRVGVTYSGQKGVRSAFYGLFLEYRIPWLRPAADVTFPTLAERIRRRLAR